MRGAIGRVLSGQQQTDNCVVAWYSLVAADVEARRRGVDAGPLRSQVDAGCIDKPVVIGCKVSSHKDPGFAAAAAVEGGGDAVEREVAQLLGKVNHWRNNVLQGMDGVLGVEA